MWSMITSARVFTNVRNFSRLALGFAIVATLIFRGFLDSATLTWQVVLSVAALALGIPHGAVDHLITIPRTSVTRFVLFIAGYVAIAIVAALAILKWNIFGFEVVIWMSALHFGFGDASYISDSDRLSGRTPMNKALEILYAIPAGTLPVIVPLVQPKSTSALAKVNSALINWAGSYTKPLEIVVLLIAVISLFALVVNKRWREVLDLVLLALLSLVAPPLVAFAFYFGCWHAIRHTARLTLLLPKAIKSAQDGSALGSFAHAVIPGLPALAGTVLVGIGIALFNSNGFSSSLLWSLLVVVWALTVPHMLATSRLDLKALGFTKRS